MTLFFFLLSYAAPQIAAIGEVAKFAADLARRVADPVRDLDVAHLHLHPTLDDHVDDVDHAEGTATQGPEDGHGGDGPEDEFQVEVFAHVGAVVRFAHGHGQDGVGHHPDDHHVRAHGSIVVLLLLGFADSFLGDLQAISKIAQRFVIARVDVELLRGHLQLNRVALTRHRGTKINVNDVVAFCAPGDIMSVAERIDLQGTDVRRKEGKVLCRGGEHMPGVEIKKGHQEVEAHGRAGGDDQVREDVVADGE